jgi:hypothetical protein
MNSIVVEMTAAVLGISTSEKHIASIFGQLEKLGPIREVLRSPTSERELSARAQGLSALIGAPAWDNQTTEIIECLIVATELHNDPLNARHNFPKMCELFADVVGQQPENNLKTIGRKLSSVDASIYLSTIKLSFTLKHTETMALEANKAKCASCIFRTDGKQVELRPERMAEIQIYLSQGTNHECHKTQLVCRGGREYQAIIWHRMGLIPEPTVEAIEAASKAFNEKNGLS